MKSNVIKINNKIATESNVKSNTSNDNLNPDSSNNNRSHFTPIIQNESELKPEDDKFLITNSCNNFSNLPSPSHTLKSENKSENDLTQVKTTVTAMKKNESDSKIQKTEEIQSPNSNTATNHNESSVFRRSRNESIREFTKRFRSFSIDLMRSIEQAHDMVDLRNSKFVSATQSAAVQQYNANSAEREEYDPEYGADVSDEGQNFLSPYYRARKNTARSIDQTLTEVDDTKEANDQISDGNESLSNGLGLEKLVKQQNNQLRHHESASNIFLSTGSLKSNTNVPEEPKTWRKFKSTNSTRFRDSIIRPENEGRSKNPNNRIDPDLLTDQVNRDNQNKKDTQNLNEIKTNDHVDFKVKRHAGRKKTIPDDIHISILEVFIYMWGVITFFADFITDIILSIEYYNNDKAWLGSMTLIFVIVPNVTLSLFSLSWYIDKYYSTQTDEGDENGEIRKQHTGFNCDSITFWITTIFFVVFQLDLVWKYIQGFVYTIKGWACRSVYKNLQWEKYYIEKQIKCDTDIGMLRLIDVFMDSGPQVLLQLYVITTQNLEEYGSANLVVFTFKDFQTTSLEIKQFVSILSSLFSMGYAMAGYHRCLRNQQFIFCLEQNKPLPRPMSWLSTFMQFLWYLFLISPRVLSMALFASTFRSWFFMIIFTHWLFMYFWILRLKTNYCITSQEVYNAREEIFEKFYDFVCSFIYIFVYFNLKSGPTRIRYLIYYIIFYSENLIFCISYFFFSKEINYIFKMSMLFIVVFGFWIAITFQIIYYLHCHPSHDIRVCVTKKKEFHFILKKTLRPASSFQTSSDDSDDGENLTDRLKKLRMKKKKKKPADIEETTSLKMPNNLKSLKTDEVLHRSMSEIYDMKSSVGHDAVTPKSIDTVRLESDQMKESLSREVAARALQKLKPVRSVSLHTLSENSTNLGLTDRAKSPSFSKLNEITSLTINDH